MGVVYEAQELDSGRIVALKVLAKELSVSGEAFERFRREARIAASISDVRCVFVYGAHQVEESPAIAMELVGGETLQERITRGEAIPIETAVRWIMDVIDGLEAAHRAGVIHRDVKPSNCFLATDGRVKVGDFGLSRTLERDIQLTQSGQFLGSPLYASPEQIRGRTLDARSDQYSCAATLYAVLTGHAPFGGSNVGEVLARILSEPAAPMRVRRPSIPRELERVVLRGMERDPEKRYRDLDAFRAALLPFSDRTAATASIPRRVIAWLLDATVYTFISGTLATVVQNNQASMVDADRPWLTMSLGAQLLLGMVPVAYFAVTEGVFGASIGKWLLGLRISSVGSGPPMWVRALGRAFLFEVVAILIGIALFMFASDREVYLISSSLVFVGAFAFRLSTMRKRNGWRGPHELWTGTRVIQSKIPFRSVRRTASPAEHHVTASTSFPEKIGEYRVLGLVGTTRSGPLLQARDERLERSVWIQFRTSGAISSEARRALNNSNRLRWLESLRSTDAPADVFESPGGAGLSAWANGAEPLDWPMTERVLVALAEELERAESEALNAPTWSPSQVWIDRNWNVRLLDEPVPPDDERVDSVALLGTTARTLLAIGQGREYPPDLPVHSEPLVRALVGADSAHASVAELRADLARSQSESTNVERRARSAQLAISTAMLALTAAFAGFLMFVMLDFIPRMIEMRGLIRELSSGRIAMTTPEYTGPGSTTRVGDGDGITIRHSPSAPEPGAEPSASDPRLPSGPELDEEGRRLRATILSYETSHGFGAAATANFAESDQAHIAAAQKLVPAPTSEEVDAARARIIEQRDPAVLAGLESRFTSFTESQVVASVTATAMAVWTLFALASTLFWPGGLSFRLFGMSIRRRNGRRAGRIFGMWRVTLFALPLTAAYGAALASIVWGSPALGWILFAVTAAAHIAGIVLTILDPSRGPIDRLLRSRIVPR